MVKLLIYSDLHLNTNLFNPVLEDGRRVDDRADLVVLAGDINEGTRGMHWARDTFPDKGIIYVAGNHELYGGHWTRTLDDLRESAKKFDIDFLEADSLDAGGVRFLGVSLWTDFYLMDPQDREPALKRARASMNDYRSIQISRTAETHFIRDSYLTPELTALRHGASVKWLEGELEMCDAAKTVVITHHAPGGDSVPLRYKTNLLSAAYASDLSHLMGKATLWIHGHIHDSVDYRLGGEATGTTRVVSNPRGYLHKNGGYENPYFNPCFVVEV